MGCASSVSATTSGPTEHAPRRSSKVSPVKTDEQRNEKNAASETSEKNENHIQSPPNAVHAEMDVKNKELLAKISKLEAEIDHSKAQAEEQNAKLQKQLQDTKTQSEAMISMLQKDLDSTKQELDATKSELELAKVSLNESKTQKTIDEEPAFQESVQPDSDNPNHAPVSEDDRQQSDELKTYDEENKEQETTSKDPANAEPAPSSITNTEKGTGEEGKKDEKAFNAFHLPESEDMEDEVRQFKVISASQANLATGLHDQLMMIRNLICKLAIQINVSYGQEEDNESAFKSHLEELKTKLEARLDAIQKHIVNQRESLEFQSPEFQEEIRLLREQEEKKKIAYREMMEANQTPLTEEEKRLLEEKALAMKEMRRKREYVSKFHTTPNIPSRVLEEGVLRIFLSSTFRDMQKERDYFFQHGVPEIKEFAKTYGVELVFIDLRWGLTLDDSRNGKVVIRCCESIEKCPYFVCLLGAKYGWIPNHSKADEWDPETDSRYPQISGYENKSVTDYEIMFASMGQKPASNRALFYFRDHEHALQNLGEGEDPSLINPIDDEQDALQQRLKEVIQTRFPAQTYQGEAHFTKLVVDDLKALIEVDFVVPEEMDKEEMAHLQFMRHRLAGFEGRSELIESVMENIKQQLSLDDSPILALAAESGIGKSSLMAALVREANTRYSKDSCVSFHFVGCTNQSSFVTSILQRTWANVNEFISLNIGDEVKVREASKAGIKRLFELYAEAVSNTTDKKVIIFIDAVNQLAPSQEHPYPQTMGWLPTKAPKNVAIVVSSIDTHESSKVMTENEVNILPVKRLSHDEIIQAAISYLKKFDKTLTTEQSEAIVRDSDDTGHPLYLRIFLDELRLFGVFERLDHEINTLLSTNGVVELYQLVCSRWEAKYGIDVVVQALSVLYISRIGLSENELDKYMSDQLGSGFNLSDWKSFLYALVDSLFVRNGRYAFFHQLLMEAVSKKYLEDEAHVKDCHLRYGVWLEASLDMDHSDDDEIAEVVHAYLKANAYQQAANFLSKSKVVTSMMGGRHRYEFLDSWRKLNANGQSDTETYKDLALEISDCGRSMIDYFRETQQFEFLITTVEKRLEMISIEDEKHVDYFTLGWTLFDTSRLRDAVSFHQKALDIRLRLFGEDNSLVADSYNHIGLCHWAMGSYKVALVNYEKSLAIRTRLYGDNHVDVAQSNNNFGALYHSMRRFHHYSLIF
eukprot:TRINITY_DN339_c0_g3_i4.p1 TRINITY_DN339_c0_g3~~TRINITY_DN339_c0_g3_i4.p1  ORF type:complete len:1206 (-),score=300.21 TRINITY_DN339_c0_g3_i4:1020-4637(-)